MFDGRGLYLEVTAAGNRLWRLKYFFRGKEKRISLGHYPLVTLAEARERCFEARKMLDQGVDPSAARRERRREVLRRAEDTFERMGRAWHETQKDQWSKEHAANVLRHLEKDLFPALGNRPIGGIDVPELLEVLRKIERRGALDIAGRARQICGQVFRYGIQTGACKEDITLHLKGALKPHRTQHFATIDAREIPELLAALARNDARLFCRTRRAIKLSLLTFARPGEIRQARRAEIDWEAKQWVIPAERMKMRRPHIVPLSRQALEVLEEQFDEVKRLETEWIFPSQVRPQKPMCESTVIVALRNLGFQHRMTAHGFRALARTTIREKLDYAPDIIEAQLAHKPAGPLGAAYDRATFLKERTGMMQAWADYLDAVARMNEGAEVLVPSG